LYDLERGEKVNTYYSKRYGVDLVRFTHHNKTILCASKRDNNCMAIVIDVKLLS